jgi:type II secretory pathway pseudopilin PulG
MNEQNNMPQGQNPTLVWATPVVVIVIALIASGVVYAMQSSNLKSSEETLQQQIVMLQNQVAQLERAQPTPQAMQNTGTEPVATDQMVADSEPANEPNGIVYTNSKYGFSFAFPQTWASYTTKNRKLNWGTFGSSDSIDFGFSVSDSLFNVSVHTKNQWKQIKSEAGPTPTYLGENNLYVFGYTTSQDAANNTIISRMKEIPSIVKTFEVLE